MPHKFNNLFFILILLAILSGCGKSSPPATSSVIAPSPTSTVSPTPAAGDLRISEVDGMEMVYIPGGDFTMGNDDGASYERPEHIVNLDGFWIDKTEVTNAMFVKFIAGTGVTKTHPDFDTIQILNYYSESRIHSVGDGWQIDEGYENHPVILVNWYGAYTYCKWAERRLPTEAEWEKAARGTDSRNYPWGNLFQCNKGNFDDETEIDAYTVPGGPNCDGHQKTAPVGSFPAGASPYGALDMSGNVLEWVNDQFNEFSYSERPEIIPTALTDLQLVQMPRSESGCPHPDAFCDASMEPDENRVIRGGSWYSDNSGSTTYSRDWEHWSEEFYTQIGFRCALSP